jgi:hypothetical protein
MFTKTIGGATAVLMGLAVGGGCASDYHESSREPYVVERAVPAGYSEAPWIYDPSYPYYYTVPRERFDHGEHRDGREGRFEQRDHRDGDGTHERGEVHDGHGDAAHEHGR